MPTDSNTKKWVLVIEDDKELNEYLQRQFRKLGCNAVGAFDGEEGLKLMNENTFDAVTVDLNMPKKGGSEVLTEMDATKSKQASAYVFTTKGIYDEGDLSWEARAKKLFVKDKVSPEEVAESVVKALNTPS